MNITKDEADATTADDVVVTGTNDKVQDVQGVQDVEAVQEEVEEETISSSGTTSTTTGGGETVMKGLFETLKEDDSTAMLSFADGFRDKVKILFEKFDIDQDGRLKHDELASLQRVTSPEEESLTKKMYLMVCQSLACHPDQGISLEALKFTYASDGADIDIDYDKVFNNNGNGNGDKKKNTKKDKKDDDDEDKIYEVGTNGVDISS